MDREKEIDFFHNSEPRDVYLHQKPQGVWTNIVLSAVIICFTIMLFVTAERVYWVTHDVSEARSRMEMVAAMCYQAKEVEKDEVYTGYSSYWND